MTDPLQPGDDGYLDLSAVSDEPLSEADGAEFAAFAEQARAQGPLPGWQDRLRPQPLVAVPTEDGEADGVVELRTGDDARPGRSGRRAARCWLVGAAAVVVVIGGLLLLRDTGDDSAPVTELADEVQPEPPARLALSVTGGNSHTCAIDTGGAMWCSGENSFGQLGNGTLDDVTVPTAVVGGVQFASLSTGGTFTCGLDTDGAAWCWGNNELGATGRPGDPGTGHLAPIIHGASGVELGLSA